MDSQGKIMTRRAVVSSFIFKFPPNRGPQVALFRRSDKVRTYPNRLAPVSGSIEKDDPSPLDAAWREIREETTLTPATLTLLRQGKDYRFADDKIGREWTIHPFAFRLKSHEDESRIQIDWEHQGFQWFEPHEVRDVDEFGGVPRLAESLRRIWFEIELGESRAKVLSEGLLALQQDHGSGARVLAARALDVFLSLVSDKSGFDKDGSVDKWWRNIRLAAWHLWKNGRECMGAAILNNIVRSLAVIEKEVQQVKDDKTPPEFLETVTQKVRDLAVARGSSVDGIWRSFEAFLRQQQKQQQQQQQGSGRPIRILTLSSSSTILQCLQRAVAGFDSDFDIRILESRPLFEGVSMASGLVNRLREAPAERKNKIEVSIYTDAGAAVASRDVDVVLVGADAIDRYGSTYNKTGSLPAVLSAKHCSPHSKVLVLADSEKILPYEMPDWEVNDVDELATSWKQSPSVKGTVSTLLGSASGMTTDEKGVKVGVMNVYFEWVPPTLIDGYLFEDGQKSAKEIADLADKIRREADVFFSDV
ncbi:NUDIX domain-containing protein [Colletotrichum higginsianum]|uniref:NUDIX domain-containing protein n=2 Tax=Colletotrichum higginsianum TaxID=80884 RepID=H1VQQ8_COLHI|nr:NUDIX domain-containing protein [Colletotrichum higginsianum IMI 349063]OBR06932.1 NUDIX domain-containing protein [Colletotrichum higginsianum IMI 349063]CCF42564.1 NUDIX domain-containing protein [Colletotrichum higginsianum]